MRLETTARRLTERPMPAYERYEDGGSERRTAGSVGVGTAAWWSGTLSVPLPPARPEARRGGDSAVAFVHLERHGAVPEGYRGGAESVDLSLPVAELDALAALLAGLVAQARRDGLLPAE